MVNLQDFGLQKHIDCSLKAMLLTQNNLLINFLVVTISRNVLAYRYI